MDSKRGKKAISPVIATVLLIVIAIALFIIIYFWIISIQEETILKFGSNIKQSCLMINYDVIYEPGSIELQNNGQVTIWRADVFVTSSGSTIKIPNGIRGPITSGDSSDLSNIPSCNQVKVIPILLGISDKTKSEKEYACTERARIVSCS